MIFVVLIIAIATLILGPQLWVRYVMRRYSKNIDAMPGSGGELAEHLLHRFELSHVKLEKSAPDQDHYDPESNTVRLSPNNFDGKSLTAIAIAAHEVGHAIQFNRNEAVSRLRKRYFPKAILIQRIGAMALVILPFAAIVIRAPQLIIAMVLIGLLGMLVSVIMYLAILPEEWDASFNKALPILKDGGYVPDAHLPTIRKILKAAAFTYVAGALASMLNLWRWLAILKGIR